MPEGEPSQFGPQESVESNSEDEKTEPFVSYSDLIRMYYFEASSSKSILRETSRANYHKIKAHFVR